MLQFILTGFKQDIGFRVFAFEATATDRTRTEYTVRADLALSRQYGISIQELPLLCRALLERRGDGDQPSAMTFTEDEMRVHANTCAEARHAALLKRKAPRRPAPNRQGAIGWRAPQPQR